MKKKNLYDVAGNSIQTSTIETTLGTIDTPVLNTNDNISISLYKEDKEEKVDIRIVVKNGTIYLDSSQPLVLAKQSNVEFIASSLGEGARTLYQLSKYNTTGEYNTRFLPSITRMKALADAAGKTISSSCIIFMQGESGGGHNDDYSIDYSTIDGYKEGL